MGRIHTVAQAGDVPPGSAVAVEIEDRNYNGKMDFHTFFTKDEVATRTEQDKNEDGQTDVWEFYEGKDADKIVLVRKEEDLNADGEVDVTSFYENGKLVRKERN